MLNLARTDLAEEAEAAVTPQVFVRAFSTPPAAPWEQGRAAALQARHGAPLPISDLVHRVKRLEGWAPGATGRYAAFYVRAAEFTGPFETRVDVDGRSVRVSFGAVAGQFRQAQTAGLIVGAAALAAAVFASGVTLALAARAEANARLEQAEQQLQVKRRAALTTQRKADQSKALARAVGQGRPIDQVLGDIAWVTAMKAPEARVEALHWDRGLLAVEVRGEAVPFLNPDRPMQRADKPIRKGVWLWGVGRGGAR